MHFSEVHPGWKDKAHAQDSALRWLVPVGKFGPVPCGVGLKKCNVIKMYLSLSLTEAEAVTHTTLL